jgi:hypothetical protein
MFTKQGMRPKAGAEIMRSLMTFCLLLLSLGCGSDTSGDWFDKHPTAKAIEDAKKWAEKEKFEYDSMNCGYFGPDVECDVKPKNPLAAIVLKCTKLGCERKRE